MDASRTPPDDPHPLGLALDDAGQPPPPPGPRSLQTVMPRKDLGDIVTKFNVAVQNGAYYAYVCPWNAGITQFNAANGQTIVPTLMCNQGYYYNLPSGRSPTTIAVSTSCSSTGDATTYRFDYTASGYCSPTSNMGPFKSSIPGDITCGGKGVAGTSCFCTNIITNPIIPGGETCIACPPGYFSTSAGATNRTCSGPCPAGRYGSTTATLNSQCSGACTPGYYCPAGSTSPTAVDCPGGYFCLAGAGSPTICPQGNFCPFQSSTGTNPCPLGKYCLPGSSTPTSCSPPIVPLAFAQVGPTPGVWNWTCNPGFYGNVVSRTCDVNSGSFSGSSPTCTACSPPAAPAFSSASNPSPFVWTYTCNAGYRGTPVSRTCDSINGGFSGTDIACSICPYNGTVGSYCPGGSDGTVRLCPGGTYGNAAGLTSSSCSGSCEAGYYCPQGSTSRIAFPCTSPANYCPVGSGAPIPVPPGFYATGTGATFSSITACPASRSCSGGGIDPGVSWGASCPVGTTLFVSEGVTGPFGASFNISTPGYGGGYIVSLSSIVGCPLFAGRNLTWSNSTSTLAVMGAAGLSYASCMSGATITLTATRRDFSNPATCTANVNITQVIRPPNITDCGPRVIAERGLAASPVTWPPGKGVGALTPGLVTTVSNVGTTVTWAINSPTATNPFFSIGVCDGILRANTPLLFRTQATYTIPITAINDGRALGIGTASSTCNATITVLPVPQTPQLTTSAFSVNDNSPNGTFLGNVGAFDVDGYAIRAYSVVPASGNGVGVVRVDAKGNLTLLSSLKAYSTGVSFYSLSLNVTSSASWGLTTVTLTVIPVAFPPTCTDPQVRTLPELSPNGTLVGLPLTATSLSNLAMNFSFPNGNSLFAVAPGSGQVRVINGGAAITFAVTPSYTLAVQVRDVNGRTGVCSLVINLTPVPKPPVWVGVGSAALGQWAWNLTEGTLAGAGDGNLVGVAALSLSVNASAAAITYSLVSMGGFTALGPWPFTIDPFSGWISVNPLWPGATSAGLLWNASFPYPATNTFVMGVQAKDSLYATTITGTARVTLVSIKPRVNTPPVVFLPSNATGGTLVVSLASFVSTVYSPATLSYPQIPPILTAEGAQAFTVSNAATGAVSVFSSPAPVFNFNTKSVYSIPFSVFDSSIPASIFSTLTINLLHSNRAPVWSPLVTGISCSPLGQTLPFSCPDTLSNFVSDLDSSLGIGETLTYNITGGNTNGTFAINPSSGVVSVVKSVSCPPCFSTLLDVTVTDAGIDGPRLSASFLYNITFQPFSPLPTLPSANWNIVEHSPQGTQLGLLLATTPATPSPQLTYTLSWSGASVNNPFPFTVTTLPQGPTYTYGAGNVSLDYASGVFAGVSSQGPLSFGPFPCTPGVSYPLPANTTAGKVYFATAYATDNRLSYPLTAQAAYKFFVVWRADPPFWNPSDTPPSYSPTRYAFPTLYVNERPATGANVTLSPSTATSFPAASVTALIKDCFLTPYLVYSLVPTTTFQIDPKLGFITVRAGAAPFTYATTKSFAVNVTATVTGVPVPFSSANGLEATTTVTIVVSETNNVARWALPGVPPLLNSAFKPVPNLTISESTLRGTVIGYVNASDPNSPSSPWGLKLYSFSPPSSQFSIDSTLGAISVAPTATLDFSTQSIFNLTVAVTDASASPLTALTWIMVYLSFNPTIAITAITVSPSSIPTLGVNVPGSPLYASLYSNHAAMFSPAGGAVILVNGTGFGKVGASTTTFSFQGSSYTGPCTVIVLNTYISCTVPPGIGSGYALVVTAMGLFSSTPTSSPLLLGYFPPVVTSVYLSTCAATPTSPTCNANMVAVGSSIIVEGSNLGAASTSNIFLVFGPSTNTNRYKTPFCTVLIGQVKVSCSAPAGIGGNFTWTLVQGTTPASPYNASVVAYAPPTVTVLSANPLPTIPSPTAYIINVTGTNFGPTGALTGDVTLVYGDPSTPGLLFGPVACVVTVAGSQARCLGAPGVGKGWRVSMVVGGQASSFFSTTTLSYALPTITGLRNLAGNALTPVPTTGGSGILIQGTGFGPLPSVLTPPPPALLTVLTPTARFGRATGATPLAFTASGCAVVVQDTVIQCQVSPGTGKGLQWQVSVGGQNSVALSSDTSSFQPPVVSTFSGAGTTSLTSGAQAVAITGSNFGPITTPSSLIAAFYGLPSSAPNATSNTSSTAQPYEFTATGCSVTTDQTGVTCNTAPGAGIGLQWAVIVDGQRSILSTTAYQAPIITSVVCTSCGGPQPSLNLNPLGGDTILITGLNFGATGLPSYLDYVVYGPGGTGFVGLGCNVTTPHTAITCFSSPGSGGGHTWSVSVRGQPHTLSTATPTSYTSPIITSVVVPGGGSGGGGGTMAVVGDSLPSSFILYALNLPLFSRNYVTFLQVGNGPSTLGSPFLRTLPLNIPATASAIAAATTSTGSVAINVQLPSPQWASTSVPYPPPPSCNLYSNPWALPPTAGGDTTCDTGDVAGYAVALRLIIVPVSALQSAGSAPVSVALAIASGGTYSTPTPLSTLAFSPPVISTIVVSSPSWLLNSSTPCAFLSPVGTQLSPTWSCNDNAILQVMISGLNFGGYAPGIVRTLSWCDPTLPGNCTDTVQSVWSPGVEPSAPQGSGPFIANSPLFIGSWSHTRIVAYTPMSRGSVRITLSSFPSILPTDPTPPLQEATGSFSDISPSITSLCVSPIPYLPASLPSYQCITPSPSVPQSFPAQAPFPTPGDTTSRMITLVVTQLQGATGLSITVGGRAASICDATGTPLTPPQVLSQVLLAQGTSAPFLWVVHFLVPPGQGVNVPIVLTRTRSGDAPTPTDFSATLDYLPPTINTVQLVTLGGTGNWSVSQEMASFIDPVSFAYTWPTALTPPTDGTAFIALIGSNLGVAPYLEVAPTSANITLSSSSPPLPCPPTLTLTPLTTPHTCYLLPSPPGEGTGLALGFWGGSSRVSVEGVGDPQTPISIPLSYAPPVVTAVTTATGEPLPQGGFPTPGGMVLQLLGYNFGRPWQGNAVTVTFGMPYEPMGLWSTCGSVVQVSQTSILCTLPAGSGRNLTLGVIASEVLGSTPGMFSYAPPNVTSVTSSEGATPLGELQSSVSGGLGVSSGGALPLAFPILRGGTRGGAVITVTGVNFGVSSPLHCVSLTWAGAPPGVPPLVSTSSTSTPGTLNPWGPDPVSGALSPYCDGTENWLGEGEVFSGSILSWTHTAVSFLVPPGLGLKNLQFSIRGNTLFSPPATTTTGASTGPPAYVPRFMYSDPQVFSIRNAVPSDALPPALVGTDGGDILIINGTNFGPGFLGNLTALSSPTSPSSAFAQLPVDCATFPTTCSALAPVAYPVVLFDRYCIAPSKLLPGYASLSPGSYAPLTITRFSATILTTMFSCNPVTAVVLSVTHDRIVFASAPGLGKNRNVSVSVLSSGWAPNALPPFAPTVQQASPIPAPFSFMPPTITSFVPSVVRVRLPPGAPPSVGIVGINFGTRLNATLEGLSNDITAVVGGQRCLPPPGVPALLAYDSLGVSTVTCVIDSPNVAMGFTDVSLFMAGQVGYKGTTPVASALLLACDTGYFGRSNETCLPCPKPGTEGFSLPGAVCDGYLDYLPNPADPSTYTTQAQLTALAYTAPYDPRTTYPRPAAGWFNLNSSDSYTKKWDVDKGYAPGTTTMSAACPPGQQVGSRDVCIVPCAIPAACVGNNYCAQGYASKPPMFRCSSCDKGFYLSAGACIPCPGSPVALVVAMALVLVIVAGGLYYLNTKEVNVAVVSIGIDFFQVLAIFADMGVKWPPAVLSLMRILAAFNLNIEIVAPECLVPNLSYIQKFSFIMAMPFALGSIFVGAFGVLWAWKKCVLCIKDRRKVMSHLPSLISSLLILMYLMYLYLTRTVMNMFDCTPTAPPDGYNYLKVVFERCGVAGGTQLTLLTPALAGLAVYSLGFPYWLGRTLYLHKELVMEDQLLRAKGVGNDRLSNPNALDFRRTYGRTYFQFRPTMYMWILVILARKFCISAVAVIFSNSVGFQMASCLMIMFLAYTLQVQTRPYMCSDDYAGELKKHRDAAAKGDALHSRLKATLDAIKSRGRKATTGKSLLAVFKDAAAGATMNRGEVLAAVGVWVFNYNTVEAVMSFCAVIVCLSGLMYQAETTKSTGLNGTLDAITGLIMFTVVFAILYFFSALASEIYTGIASFQAHAAARKNGKAAVISSSAESEESGLNGNIEAQVNPMFLSDDGDKANLGADKDSLVASILAQKESPPLQLWVVFRDEFASLVERLKETSAKAAEGAAAMQKLEILNNLNLGPRSKATRKEFEAQSPTSLSLTTPDAESPAGASSKGTFAGVNPLRSAGGTTPNTRRGGVLSSARSAQKEEEGGGYPRSVRFDAASPFPSSSSSSSFALISREDDPSPTSKLGGVGGGGVLPVEAPTTQEPVQPVGEEGEDLLSIPGLPHGWKARMTSKGKVLYFNESTGETTYKTSKVPGFDPDAAATASSQLPGTVADASSSPSPLEGARVEAATPAAAAAAPLPTPPTTSSTSEAEPTYLEVPGLPEGWRARLTSKGKTMYWCEETGESTYKLEKVPGYTAPSE